MVAEPQVAIIGAGTLEVNDCRFRICEEALDR
jgi:hypothetical protein